jgi:hypothetical protein
MMEFLKKELRALVPSAVLIGVIYSAFYLYWLSTEFPDLPSSESNGIVNSDSAQSEGWESLVLIYLFSTIVGTNLLIGERTAGTLRFLDALPTTRTRIFFTKVAAALLVLALDPIMGWVIAPIMEWVIENQFSVTQDLSTLLGAAALDLSKSMVLYFCLLSVTLLLSFSGTWFPMVAGFVFWGFLGLRAQQLKWMGLLDPSEFFGAPGFSWGHAAALIGTGAVFLGLAWGGFLVLGDRLEHAVDRMGRVRLAPVYRLAWFILTPAVWIGVLFQLHRIAPSASEKPEGIAAYEETFGSELTQRYQFVFREGQRENAKEIVSAADGLHDRVTAFLRADPMPVPIVVDLATSVDPRAAGVTNWTKIRVPLELGENLEFLKVVLGHETTHVYINHLGRSAMHRDFESTRFFHEGLSTFVEHNFFSTHDEQRKMRRVAAFAHSRGRIPFAILSDNGALKADRDENLVYPLGELFCQALVSTYGDPAPGLLLRSFARLKPSAGLRGVELWRTALQSCGFDLERVVAAYDAALESSVQEEAEFIARFPKSSAVVEIVGSDIVIRRKPSEVVSARPVFRLPSKDGITPPFSVEKDGSIRIPRSGHTNPRLRYMLGWASDDVRLPLFEPWAEADLNSVSRR